MSEKVSKGAAGATHVGAAPMTTEIANANAPGLLRNAIDERIVRIRPMATPVDQISRCAAARHCQSMIVNYYTVDTKETDTYLAEACAGGKGRRYAEGVYTHILHTRNDAIIGTSETLLLPTKGVPSADDKTKRVPLVLYVVNGSAQGGGIEVMPVNGEIVTDSEADGGDTYMSMPALTKGCPIVRMGRAATELDVQTEQFSSLPVRTENYCQIFKMQIEQSTLMKLADKDVRWSMSDQEEAAVIDMRQGMEKNFLFGTKSKIYDPVKGEYVFLTGGIWGQAKKDYTLDLTNLTEDDLIGLCSQAFTGTGGSRNKILLAGTRLVEALSRLPYTKAVSGGETRVKWGIEFKEIRTNFGTLHLVHSEIFDKCGYGGNGFILDPEYLTKYTHVPFSVDTLDLRRSGTRNTDAVVLTEASCLVLRYPQAHMRITGE